MSDEPWKLWLQRAKSNLARARLGKQSEEILYEDLCFDAQQAAEKALKGLLLYFNLDFPRTHSIGHLLNLLEKSGRTAIPETIKTVAMLTDYAVSARYPGDWEPIEAKEYQQALVYAEKAYNWVLSELSKMSGEEL